MPRHTFSLVDWDMSSDRNCILSGKPGFISLVDWDMSSDRNLAVGVQRAEVSLVDWDMSSDRNCGVDRWHLIENFFARLKQYRAIATRYDKTARNFLGALHLAGAMVTLN